LSLAILKNATNKLNEVQGKFDVIIKNKLNYALDENFDLQKINTIRDILLNKNEN